MSARGSFGALGRQQRKHGEIRTRLTDRRAPSSEVRPRLHGSRPGNGRSVRGTPRAPAMHLPRIQVITSRFSTERRPPDLLSHLRQALPGAAGGDHEACRATHLPSLVRDAPARGWVRHSDRAGAARARGRQHDHGVHACAQSWSARRAESCRSTLMSANAVGREQWRPNQGRRACGSTGEMVDLQDVGRFKVVARRPH